MLDVPPATHRMLATLALLLVVATPSAAAWAQAPQVAAPLRIWGHGHRGQDYILTLVKAWQDAYRTGHPEAQFDDQLDGDASAMGGLWTGHADIAILDREASFIEVDGYQQGTGHDPFGIAVARGSVSTPRHAPALAIYVSRENPLAQLTRAQVDGIFDADHRLSERRFETWGDLGLTGEWAARKIQLYTFSVQTAQMQFFERAAMKGSQKLSCCLTTEQSEAELAAAARRDKFALALTDWPIAGMKAIPLSGKEGVTATLPTPAAIISGAYPLARTVYIYVNRKPHTPLSADVAGFLGFIVSAEGQAIVTRTGGYLPLSPEAAAASREMLK